MKLPNIAFDFDGCVMNIMDSVINQLNKKFPTINLTVEDITEYGFEFLNTKYGISPQEGYDAITVALQLTEHPAYDGAISFISQYAVLIAPKKITFITSRHQEDLITAIAWFRDFSSEYAFFIPTHDKPYEMWRLGFDTIIEDNPDRFINKDGKMAFAATVLVPDRPWNRNITNHPNIIRFYSWHCLRNLLLV